MVPTAPRVVVLVEGRSDEGAVVACAHVLGVDLRAAGVQVHSVGGAMGLSRAVARWQAADEAPVIAGIVDEAEAGHACRALFAGLRREPFDGALANAGFFVCSRDLEDELIRAHGLSGVQRILHEHGDLDRFRLFQRQPAHRDEPVGDQLRRFLGTTSGRKVAYGRHLVESLTADRVPDPLRSVVMHAVADAR